MLLKRPHSLLSREGGVVRASVTRLATRLRELESKVDAPTTPSFAQRMSTKLDTLDSDFKAHHLAVIDAIAGDEEGLTKEQEILDAHDDEMTSHISH